MNEEHDIKPSQLRFLSVCSGIEAASVAWEPIGWKAVGFSEIEPFPCAVLKHRFPNTPNHGDLTKWKSWGLEPGSIDLLVSGTPCQAFSVAGLRKGLADPRGNLALVFLGLADSIKPKWIVWENVPGVLSSNGGRDFGSFLGALVELGYGVAYRVLDASRFGVPQRRRRVFLIGCLGDWRSAAEVLFESDCLRRDPSSRRKKGEGITSCAKCGVEPDSQKPIVIDRAAFNQGANAQYEPHIEQTEVMDTLVSKGPHAVGHHSCAGHQHRIGDYSFLIAPLVPMAVRRLTPNECLRLQGFPDDWTKIPWKGKPADETPDGPQYKAAGNSMAVPCMRWIGERIAKVDAKRKAEGR